VATLDHIILKVNDLEASVAFYTGVVGFIAEGTDGPFTILRVSPDLQIQIAPWGTPGFEHYAFSVSKADFDGIFGRIKAAGIAYTCSRSGRMSAIKLPQQKRIRVCRFAILLCAC